MTLATGSLPPQRTKSKFVFAFRVCECVTLCVFCAGGGGVCVGGGPCGWFVGEFSPCPLCVVLRESALAVRFVCAHALGVFCACLMCSV